MQSREGLYGEWPWGLEGVREGRPASREVEGEWSLEGGCRRDPEGESRVMEPGGGGGVAWASLKGD